MIFIGIESATGDVYVASARNSERAYRIIGEAMGMKGTDDPNFDTGNVDVDLYKLPSLKNGEFKKLSMDE